MFGFSSGVTAHMVSSSTYADELIREFEKYIARGYNPNDICNEVFESVGVDSSDLTSSDYNRVQSAVEEMWRRYN